MAKTKQTNDPKLEGLELAIAYSPAQFAHVVGISLSTVWLLWREGKGPPFARIGKRRVISRADAEEWLAKRVAITSKAEGRAA
ncbi:MAG: helix-turn-helix transcriptional regulator [Xanthobacteraceae bacterium]